ncbi:MAG: restriction endonuclease [Nitrospirota bacterium]
MSYLILAAVLLIVFLGVIALFDEAREVIRSGKRHADKVQRERLIERALKMKGRLHKMDVISFQKLVETIYDGIGYQTKHLTVGKENVLLIAQKEVYTLVGYNNNGWPLSREALEILYHHKKKMELDAMIMISTGGFNLSAWEWAQEHDGIKLLNEEDLTDLCNEIAAPQPTRLPLLLEKEKSDTAL